MTSFRFFYFLIGMFLFWQTALHGLTWDNRFLPLLEKEPYSRSFCKRSVFIADSFFAFGNSGILDEDTVGLPEIFGKYDQNKLAQAMIAAGYPNPGIPAGFSSIPLPWEMHGKIQTQGIAFQYNQDIYKYFSIGTTFFLMHSFSRQYFTLPESFTMNLDESDFITLDTIRRQMNDTIGITETKSGQGGFSDLDLYLRIGNVWEYPYKFKQVDAGLRVGIIAPTGVKTKVAKPASIPFGGDGFWGMYGQIEADFELKEDWRAGGLFRVSKRFSKTKFLRFPALEEQPLYGVLTGYLKIDPGVTLVLSPYVRWEGIRDGLGMTIEYTLIYHEDDSVIDERSTPNYPANINVIRKISEWSAEYATFNVFYDFTKVRIYNHIMPVISLRWDLPMSLLIADRVPKVNRVLFGIEFNF